jgi:ribosomal protein L4
LASHASAGTLSLVDAATFDTPSTKAAAALVESLARPLVVVCTDDEVALGRSFRNLDRVAVVQPSELEIGAVVWARSLVVTQAALPLVEGRAR